MKARSQKPSKAPNDPPSADNVLTMAQAVKLIARRMNRAEGEELRGVEDRVRHLLTYAVKQGHLLAEAGPKFRARNLGLWLRRNPSTKGKFDDWPNVEPIVGHLNAVLPVFQSDIDGVVLPTTLPECHQLVRQLIQRLEAARDAQAVAAEAIAALGKQVSALENQVSTMAKDVELSQQRRARRRIGGSGVPPVRTD